MMNWALVEPLIARLPSAVVAGVKVNVARGSQTVIFMFQHRLPMETAVPKDLPAQEQPCFSYSTLMELGRLQLGLIHQELYVKCVRRLGPRKASPTAVSHRQPERLKAAEKGGVASDPGG